MCGKCSLLSTSTCAPVASVVAMQPWTALSMMTRKYQQRINWFLALALALLLDIFMEMRNKNSPCTAMISCSAEFSMLLRKGQSWSVSFCHMTCGALVAFWKVEMFSSRCGKTSTLHRMRVTSIMVLPVLSHFDYLVGKYPNVWLTEGTIN